MCEANRHQLYMEKRIKTVKLICELCTYKKNVFCVIIIIIIYIYIYTQPIRGMPEYVIQCNVMQQRITMPRNASYSR